MWMESEIIKHNNLKKMKKGSLFFYHSVSERSIVGIVKVVAEYYPDPTDETGKFVAVDVKPEKIKEANFFNQIKKEKKLKDIALIKQSRLSVMPLKKKMSV